jgi:hypothetical protein
MRSFIILLFVLLAGVQESKAWVIYEYYSRSVDQPRTGYSNTSHMIILKDVPFTLSTLRVKIVLISCSGTGYESCPTQVATGELDDPFDAAQVNHLVEMFESAVSAGQGSGSQTIHYRDVSGDRTFVYRMDWHQENGRTKMTIDKSVLPL